jgi:hypothetical protein
MKETETKLKCDLAISKNQILKKDSEILELKNLIISNSKNNDFRDGPIECTICASERVRNFTHQFFIGYHSQKCFAQNGLKCEF